MNDPNTIQGWEINLKDYHVQVGEKPNGEPILDRYDVKGSMVALLFQPRLELTIEQAFEMKDLADKIRKANGSIILDQSDYQRLKRAYNAMRSPAEQDLELFSRIRDAKQIQINTRKPKK